MICTIGRFLMFIPQASSLKQKRSVVRSMIHGLRTKYDISAIESDHFDKWQKTLIGIAYLSIDHKQADKKMAAIMSFLDTRADLQLMQETVEKIGV